MVLLYPSRGEAALVVDNADSLAKAFCTGVKGLPEPHLRGRVNHLTGAKLPVVVLVFLLHFGTLNDWATDTRVKTIYQHHIQGSCRGKERRV